MKVRIFAFAAVMAVLCLTAESVFAAQAPRLRVITATFPLYDWTRQILGKQLQDVELIQLQDNGVDLHNFQPSVRDIARIAQCDLFVFVGGESDGWAETALRSQRNPRRIAVNLLKELGDAAREEEHLEGMEEHDHDHHHDAKHDHDHDHDKKHDHDHDKKHDHDHDKKHEHDHHHDDDDDEHEHHHHPSPSGELEGGSHHHHHHHDEGEAEEYGIGTYVYYRRPALNLGLFDEFVARRWPKGVIRAKGICWFHDEPDMCYVFEQAGKQVSIRQAGQWYATMPENELRLFKEQNPGLQRDWDDRYGDRMQKLVFIGQHLDKEAIARELDRCLEE